MPHGLQPDNRPRLHATAKTVPASTERGTRTLKAKGQQFLRLPCIPVPPVLLVSDAFRCLNSICFRFMNPNRRSHPLRLHFTTSGSKDRRVYQFRHSPVSGGREIRTPK